MLSEKQLEQYVLDFILKNKKAVAAIITDKTPNQKLKTKHRLKGDLSTQEEIALLFADQFLESNTVSLNDFPLFKFALEKGYFDKFRLYSSHALIWTSAQILDDFVGNTNAYGTSHSIDDSALKILFESMSESRLEKILIDDVFNYWLKVNSNDTEFDKLLISSFNVINSLDNNLDLLEVQFQFEQTTNALVHTNFVPQIKAKMKEEYVRLKNKLT